MPSSETQAITSTINLLLSVGGTKRGALQNWINVYVSIVF